MSPLPEIAGDPAGMRAFASTLRTLAANVATESSSVAGSCRSASFEGPAAKRFLGTVRLWETDLGAAAEELLSAASTLEISASQVEAEQAARARLLQQMRENERFHHR